MDGGDIVYYTRPIRSDELYHHGVKGQKWGLRRFQNSDGSLTAKGRERYRVDNFPNKVGRMVFNTEFGQRFAVRRNKGFREDKKAIKDEYKKATQKVKDKVQGKEQTKEQKLATKETLKELKAQKNENINTAKVAAADAIYGKQSHNANKVIQTESTGKAFAKTMMMGGFGAKRYNEIRYNPNGGAKRGRAFISGYIYGDAALKSPSLGYLNYASESKTARAKKNKK